MAGGHRHAADHHHLHVPGDTLVHRLPASAKIVGLVLFTGAVALTPRQAVVAFVVDAGVLAVAIATARLRWRLVLGRVWVIAPFLAVAAVVPFVAEGGQQVDVAGRALSEDGLWSAWNIAAKATLGATAGIVVSATTSVPDLLAGLGRLRLPKVLVAIVSFMFRYLDLLVDQLRRMRNAMVARCHDPRWLWQVRPIASSAGALFVRSYERGERVHQAMAARGFTGTIPQLDELVVTRAHYAAAAVPGMVATASLLVAVAR